MSERMRCVHCGNVLYSRPYSCCGEVGHCVPDLDESDADPVARPLRHAYQLGYERGYNAGYDVPPMYASDLITLRQFLLTHPETGEPLFICGEPEKDFLDLVRFKVCGADGSVWTGRAGLREGWLTKERRERKLIDSIEREFSMTTEEEIEDLIRWPLKVFDKPEELARAVARAAIRSVKEAQNRDAAIDDARSKE